MCSKRSYPAFWTWLLTVLLLAGCDFGSAEETLDSDDAEFTLRLSQVLNGDTTLTGTFAISSEQAFDLSRTVQKRYPTASAIRGVGLQGLAAQDSVSRGSLFLFSTTPQSPPSLYQIGSHLRDQAAPKQAEATSGSLDQLALYFFLLERPRISLPDAFTVTYGIILRTETDTFRIDDSLQVSSSDSANMIRAHQMDVAQGTDLNLQPQARRFLLDFSSEQLDERIVPCLVIHYPIQVEHFRTWDDAFCAQLSRADIGDGYKRFHVGRPDPLPEGAEFRFFLLRTPAEDA